MPKFNQKRRYAARKIQRKYRSYRRAAPPTAPAFARLKRKVNRIALASPAAEVKQCISVFDEAPTVTVPTLKALNTPDSQSLSVDGRVGAKVRFTHISGKLRMLKRNWGDKRSSATIIAYIIWLKNADYSSDFETNFAKEILNHDQNGEFSPMSYFNSTRYGSWVATNKFKVTLKDQIPLSQAAMGLVSATGDPPSVPSQTGTKTLLGKVPQTQFHYINFNKKLQIEGEWQNKYTIGADETKMTRMKPYLFCYTDCVGQTTPSGSAQPLGILNDSVGVQGTMRLSFVDA